MYTSGSFTAATHDFSEHDYGADTKRVREGSVAKLLKHRNRFDSLMAVAMSQVPSFKEAQAQQARQDQENDDAYDAADPSSSPAPDQFY